MVGAKPKESPMERRSLLQLACAIMPISLLTTRAEAAAPDQSKVVYHLSDLDKADFRSEPHGPTLIAAACLRHHAHFAPDHARRSCRAGSIQGRLSPVRSRQGRFQIGAPWTDAHCCSLPAPSCPFRS